jgi:hypothetical protein
MGFFSEVLDVAGSFVGDPTLGNQVAANAKPGFAPITQDQTQIATTVAPLVSKAIAAPIPAKSITSQAQQIATGIAPQVAQDMLAAGYVFAPGTLGASYQNPSIFDAFGGPDAGLVKVGFGILAVWAGFKVLKAL